MAAPSTRMVAPGGIHSVAEEMGLIVEIGNQVLYKACLECRRWPGDTRRGGQSSRRSSSIVPTFPRSSENARRNNIPAYRLEIEITRDQTLLRGPGGRAPTCVGLRSSG